MPFTLSPPGEKRNVLSIMAQCMSIAGLVTLLWWAFGYSVTFAPGMLWFGW